MHFINRKRKLPKDIADHKNAFNNCTNGNERERKKKQRRCRDMNLFFCAIVVFTVYWI